MKSGESVRDTLRLVKDSSKAATTTEVQTALLLSKPIRAAQPRPASEQPIG